jgi:hypothetical protein
MLVVGYPVNYETICKFFNVSSEEGIDVEKLVKEKTELEFYSTDKGQYVIGLEVKEIRDLWDKFTPVDDALILILQKKKLAKELFEKAKIDLSDFMIEKIFDTEYVNNKIVESTLNYLSISNQ